MSIEFLVFLGGGILGFGGGGGSADFIFMGARIFLTVRLGQKRRTLLTTGRWGKQRVTYVMIGLLQMGV